MGITGLLPFLKSIQRPVHLSDYQGKTLAIDGYAWLHKASYGCAMELCLETSKGYQRLVESCMQRINLLLKYNITPYVVFDGAALPMKMLVDTQRHCRRREQRGKAMDCLRRGQRTQAMEFFQQCVDISPEHVYPWIQALKKAGLPYVVAPYEADAQLAFLEHEGLVDGILTEDSDLLVFGCQNFVDSFWELAGSIIRFSIPMVLFKLDREGHAIEIRGSELGSVEEVNLRGWTLTQFRHMCMLSGCDYLPNLQGLGLKTSYKLIRRYHTVDRALTSWRLQKGSKPIPEDYLTQFEKAELTFQHQRVYDPRLECLVFLTPLEAGRESMLEQAYGKGLEFLGRWIEPGVAKAVALGDLSPIDHSELGTVLSSKTASNAEPSNVKVQVKREKKNVHVTLEQSSRPVFQLKKRSQTKLTAFFEARNGSKENRPEEQQQVEEEPEGDVGFGSTSYTSISLFKKESAMASLLSKESSSSSSCKSYLAKEVTEAKTSLCSSSTSLYNQLGPRKKFKVPFRMKPPVMDTSNGDTASRLKTFTSGITWSASSAKREHVPLETSLTL